MELATIIALAQAAAQLTKAVGPLLEQLRGTLGTEDQAKLDAALAELSAENDALHDRLRSKLVSPP